jgi:hypothetical protein
MRLVIAPGKHTSALLHETKPAQQNRVRGSPSAPACRNAHYRHQEKLCQNNCNANT